MPRVTSLMLVAVVCALGCRSPAAQEQPKLNLLCRYVVPGLAGGKVRDGNIEVDFVAKTVGGTHAADITDDHIAWREEVPVAVMSTSTASPGLCTARSLARTARRSLYPLKGSAFAPASVRFDHYRALGRTMTMTTCKECSADISTTARACPKCVEPLCPEQKIWPSIVGVPLALIGSIMF